MKVKEFVKEILKKPELAEYNLCLTKFMLIPKEGTQADHPDYMDVDEVIFDVNIMGIAVNDEGKELRFVLDTESARAIDDAELGYLDLPELHRGDGHDETITD